MKKPKIKPTLVLCLAKVRDRLDRAASLARSAEACGKSGDLGKAIEIALDIEQLTYEADMLLNAASLLHRISKTERNV
jgi:hypothetical protein